MFNEANYENAVISLLETIGYTHLYGPDIERDYHNPLYMGAFTDQISRINPKAHSQAIEEASAHKEGDDLGLSSEELAFYHAITKPDAVKDFYSNDQLREMTRELTDMLRKSRTIDWQIKTAARAGMRMAVKRLLKKYKYPPEGMDDAIQTVISQCELWTDENIG